MSAEDPIPTDASTVHRTSEPDSTEPPTGLVPQGADAEEMAAAKTVIRGSSQGGRPAQPAEPLNRSPAAVAQVLLGQKLNHFLLEEMIGGGGMGAVFRAHDEQLDRTVAIKVIPFVGDDPDLQRRFRNEAQSAAKLDHPRIARVFDAGSQSDWHYIVFEYIEGTNIRDLVAHNGVLSIDDSVYYTSQLADALQHASDRGIVHRDIKPSNILIGSDGSIKLVDMGLARSENLDLSDDMTASGVTLGTFDYISPEQAHDPRDADLRSDIYSLGCTLYFMLTGYPPYPGGTMLQKLLSHGNAPPPDAREFRPEVSDNLVAVIQKMLAKKPSDRYQTATDLIADLREVAIRDGLDRTQSLAPVAVAPAQPLMLWLERHAPWIVAAMLLLAGAGWLQLESAAFRKELTIPASADRPVLGLSEASLEERPSSPLVEESGEPGRDADVPEVSDENSPFGPPETQPMLRDVPVPEDWDGETRNFDPELQIDDIPFGPFAMDPSSRVSIEPLEQPEISVIRVVSPQFQPDFDLDAEGIATATTLAAALDLAAKYESASRVEISVPVVYCSEPVSVKVDDLQITSTVGGSTIIFQPADSVAMARSKMFVIGSHPIVFEDIHFVWNVPSGDLDGGTLFELHDNDLIRLTDCSITVSNPTLRKEVYAFEVITDPGRLPIRDREDDENEEVFPHVLLELNNVVVRGQMTMLHMDYAAKLWLDWDNGLLAVTERMIDTAGARVEPEAAAGPIRMKLWRVTADTPEGIFLMRLGVSGAYPVPVDRLAHDCVFVVDPGKPHYDFTGLPSLSGITPLRLHGRSNVYVTDIALSDPMLSVQAGDSDAEKTRMEDIFTATPAWAMDKSPRWTVDWLQAPLTDAPASQRTADDYRQRDQSPLGFDEKSLPTIPSSEQIDADSVRSARQIPSNRDELSFGFDNSPRLRLN